MMNEEILDFVDEEYEGLCLDDKAKDENVCLGDISYAGSGKTSLNMKIGEYILKVGRTRRTKIFKNSPRILQPVIRREIEVTPEEKLFIEVQNEVNSEWYKEEKDKIFEVMYQVYKDIRESGCVWTDIRFTNIVKLIKDNRVNYDTFVHDDGRQVRKEICPDEKATGLRGKLDKVLKAGDYVLLDTDFVFDENDLPNGKSIKETLSEVYYNNFEMRYMKEKREKINKSR